MYATYATYASDHRKRIRRPPSAVESFAAPQADPFAAESGTSSISAGHSFGRVAVTSHALHQADGERVPEQQDAEAPPVPTLLPTDGLDIEQASPAGDESDPIAMDSGNTGTAKPQASSRPRRIRAKLDLTTKIVEEATDPEKKSDFGITHFSVPTYTSRAVALERGVFVVKAALAAEIRIKVRPSVGPDGQKNITGADDSAINSSNFPAIVQDFTPFRSHPEAGSPCTHFWARELTVKHEHVHAADDDKYSKQGTEIAQGQMSGLRAKDTAAVDALLDRVPDFIFGNVAGNMGPPSEKRAYTHISPLYQALADAIKAKGDSGKYPPPP